MNALRIILAFCLLFFAFYPVKAQEQFSENQATEMLKNFYTEYITEQSKEPTPENYKSIVALQKRYCSEGLLRRIKRQQANHKLSYGPFLNAQDSSIEWLKSLTVKKNTQVENGYTVSYLDSYSGELVEIKLIVTNEKEMGSYKISSIL